MRKASTIRAGPAAALASAMPTPVAVAPTTDSNNPDGDVCPICKTIRYLNRDMVLQINPECYHPMCSNCVARLFAGPNQCPYPGCARTLRRKDFRQAYFGDLAVEREVDIRRRVASVFNKVEDDFDSLASYNAYLEMVETLAMDLVAGPGPDRRAADARLQAYEAEHRADIERNRRKGERAAEASRAHVAAERDAARRRRLDAQRQDDDARRARAAEREADIDALATAPEGAAGRVVLKRRGQAARDEMVTAEDAALRRAAAGGLTIRGLKEKKRGGAGGPGADGPYDAFAGLDLAPSRYADSPGDGFRKLPWLEREARREALLVGGYDVHDYYARAMLDAFAGLGVFIDDEKETGVGTTAASVATVGAAIAAGVDKMDIDDVF